MQLRIKYVNPIIYSIESYVTVSSLSPAILLHCAVLLDHVWVTEAMEGGTVGKGVGCGTGTHSMLLLKEEVMNEEKPVLGLGKSGP